MILVSGYIKNQSGQPIPGASIQVVDGDFNLTGEGTAANAVGFFTFYINEFYEPYGLNVSSVGYKPTVVKLSTFTNNGTIILATNVVDLPPVVVYSDSDKNKNLIWLAGAGILLLLMNDKKKRVGKIQSSDVKTAALAVGALILISSGSAIINKILQLLGIKDSEATTNIDNIFTSGDQNNFWSPNFYKYGPAGQTRILTPDAANAYATGVKNSLGILNDDEDGLYGLARAMPTQSCWSSVAEAFFNKYYKDMLSYLRGGYPPLDGLSDAELNKLNEILLAKPKYW